MGKCVHDVSRAYCVISVGSSRSTGGAYATPVSTDRPSAALISKQQVPRGQRVTSLNITTISVHFLPPPRSRQPLFPEGEPGLSRNKAHRTPLPPEYFHFHFLVSCCCHKLKNPTRFNSQLLYCKFTHLLKCFGEQSN